MADAGMDRDGTVAIVGGGYSGTLLAINLARADGPRTVLIERRPDQLGRGVAYSTPHPSQLLNVCAGGMSALADEPDHFARWMTGRGGIGAHAFVPRALYGAYLRELLVETAATAGDRLVLRKGRASDIVRTDAGVEVILADGARVAADAAVLAVGNLPPLDPPGIDGDALPADLYVSDPWRDDPTAGLEPQDRIVLIGTGLTAVDVALALDAAGFEGEIVAVSRRGLQPRAHVVDQPPFACVRETPTEPLSHLVANVRAVAKSGGDWRGAVDALRPVTQALWASADRAERGRFLRHLRPFWDVHRHRIAPAVAGRIDALVASGRLTFRAGKTLAVAAEGEGVRLDWRPRHRAAAETMHVRRIVNCTGPQGDLTRSDEPLLRTLANRGTIRPDRLRLGIDVDEDLRVLDVSGRPDPRLFCVGPMTRGAAWEIVAVPDLRHQSEAAARRIAQV